MEVLIVTGFLHIKNRKGLELLCNELKIKYKFGSLNDISDFNIIYSPAEPIDSNLYPDKKFIFGPHFSVFPDNRLKKINNKNNNSIYIEPSDWVRELWINLGAERYLPIKTFSFPVEVDKFKPIENSIKNEKFIYFKRRDPQELSFIENFLKKQKITYKIFDYNKRYHEKEYLKCLQNARYGIILDAHESQGFAIEEALSCNVPLLVWKVNNMSQEYGSNYSNINATTIPYWDERCGEFFKEKEKFEEVYYKFINKLDTYKPREFILENLSPKKCGERFKELIESI
jgi:hypothetical protein